MLLDMSGLSRVWSGVFVVKQNRGSFVKEVSVTVLVQGKKMSSLLEVCESYIEECCFGCSVV